MCPTQTARLTYMCGLACHQVSPLVVVELLHRIVDVFETYFTKVTEQTMQANFATVYQVREGGQEDVAPHSRHSPPPPPFACGCLQLLEEMVDNGYPLITEPNTLMTMIKPPSVGARMKAVITVRAQQSAARAPAPPSHSHIATEPPLQGRSTSVSDRMAAGAMSVIPWRAEAAMHKKNEIFFDVVEEVDCIQDRCRRLQPATTAAAAADGASIGTPSHSCFVWVCRLPAMGNSCLPMSWVSCAATADCPACPSACSPSTTCRRSQTWPSTPVCASTASRRTVSCPLCHLTASLRYTAGCVGWVHAWCKQPAAELA